jgi:uncharacterized membrane protein
MTYDWPLFACAFLALWSAVVGGVFSAFSEFIMAGLLRAESKAGIQAMQQINKTVIRTQFVAGIMLIPVLSILFAVHAANTMEGIALFALVLAPAIYVPSVFLMTLFGNVPMNKRLDSFDPASPEAAAYWEIYGRKWTRLNHFRTIGSVLTAGLYILAAIALISSAQA